MLIYTYKSDPITHCVALTLILEGVKTFILLTLPFLSTHFTSVSGYRIFHGLSPKYFSDSYCGSVKTNFNFRDNLKLRPNNITMLDNIIASTFNDIPFHIRSSLNVKLFKTHYKRFHSTFSWLSIALFFLSKSFFLSNWIWKTFLSNEIYANKEYIYIYSTARYQLDHKIIIYYYLTAGDITVLAVLIFDVLIYSRITYIVHKILLSIFSKQSNFLQFHFTQLCYTSSGYETHRKLMLLMKSLGFCFCAWPQWGMTSDADFRRENLLWVPAFDKMSNAVPPG